MKLFAAIILFSAGVIIGYWSAPDRGFIGCVNGHMEIRNIHFAGGRMVKVTFDELLREQCT